MDPMVALKAAVNAFKVRDQSPFTLTARGEELRELREVIDALEVEFSSSARAFQLQGGHLADGSPGVVSWLRQNCKMSGTSAADRVCVGKELESLPHTAESLATGRLWFQSAAAICHLYEQAAERREDLDEEFNFSRRRLHISALSDGMQVIDAILDPVGGAAVKTALEALATSGTKDDRKHSQRMADALVEMAHHAMDEGKLPTKRGVRAHLNVSTTLEALQGLPGAGASELESMPISQKTLERLCCDCTVSRVMFAESVPIDVGRATRAIHPATRRALRARDKHCRWPGCDRPINWTSPHHIEFWSRGGPTKPPNLLSLCWFHHRLVHEGGWQVVKAGDEYRFIPPQQRSVLKEWRARGPGYSRAA